MTDASADSDLTPMTHRQKIEALAGLLLGMFVAFLSSTVVSDRAARDASGICTATTDQHTWIVSGDSLLASTATTPIWGKFADLMTQAPRPESPGALHHPARSSVACPPRRPC